MNIGFSNVSAPQQQTHYVNTQTMQYDNQMDNTIKDNTNAGVKKKDINDLLKTTDCITCAERTYQDHSSDGGVSMQSPTNLSPEEAGGAVRAHEREHIVRDSAKAESEGREVISSNVRIFTSECPECGKTYVSGGEATTVTANKAENREGALYQPQQLLDLLV